MCKSNRPREGEHSQSCDTCVMFLCFHPMINFSSFPFGSPRDLLRYKKYSLRWLACCIASLTQYVRELVAEEGRIGGHQKCCGSVSRVKESKQSPACP